MTHIWNSFPPTASQVTGAGFLYDHPIRCDLNQEGVSDGCCERHPTAQKRQVIDERKVWPCRHT